MNDTDDFAQAYVLHRRPFRETSALVALWVENQGLVRAVIKGVAGQSKSAILRNAWLQPFQLIRVQIRGTRDLKTIYKFEPVPTGVVIKGEPLFACTYINELLLFTLNKHEPELHFFSYYQEFLKRITDIFRPDAEIEPALRQKQMIIELRCFEQYLLEAIGYSFDWGSARDENIEVNMAYGFEPGEGFFPQASGLYQGALLIAIAQGQWQTKGALGAARAALRQQLEWVLGRSLHAPSSQGKLMRPENG